LYHEGELRLEPHIGAGVDVREQIVVAELPGRIRSTRPGLDADVVDIRQVARLVETK